MKITSFWITKKIYEEKLAQKFSLKPATHLVLIALSSHYNDDKKCMYPGQEYIAEHCNISIRTVQRAVKELTNKGLILVECNHSNTYAFTGIFFEAVKLTACTSQDVTKMHDKLSSKHDNKQINNNKKNKSVFCRQDGVKYQSAKPIIQQIKKDRTTSINPFASKADALKFIKSHPVETELDQEFIKRLCAKFNLKVILNR